MISKEILKKHNLKAVPFSCIGEGQTFWTEGTIFGFTDYARFARVRDLGEIRYASGWPLFEPEFVCSLVNKTVYVPVWRVTEELST